MLALYGSFSVVELTEITWQKLTSDNHKIQGTPHWPIKSVTRFVGLLLKPQRCYVFRLCGLAPR